MIVNITDGLALKKWILKTTIICLTFSLKSLVSKNDRPVRIFDIFSGNIWSLHFLLSFVCLVSSGRTSSNDSKYFTDLTTERIVSLLHLNGHKLFIRTPNYCEPLSGDSVPVQEFPDLIVHKKYEVFDRPEFYLTSYPAAESDVMFLRVFVENNSQLDVPPYFVKFDMRQFESLKGSDVVRTVVDSLGVAVLSSEFKIDGKEVDAHGNAVEILKAWRMQKGVLTVELDAKAVAMMKKRSYILEEIIMTEESYIKDLNTINTFWRPEIEAFGIMSEGDLHVLFKDIPAILTCHRAFLDELKKAGSRYASQVAAIFVQYSQGFRVSQLYIGNYANLTGIVRSYNEKPKFATKLQKLTKRHDDKDLLSYMITPVQRLPRYCLFLRDLLKVTPVSHPDFEYLQEAFHELEKVTRDIDVSSAIGKKAARLMDIQKCIRNNFLIVKQHRELIVRKPVRIGTLIHKHGHAYLFNDLIVFTKSGDHCETVIFDSEIRCFPFRNQFPAVNSMTVDSTGKSYLRKQGTIEFCVHFKTCEGMREFVAEVEKLQQVMELKQGWSYPMCWKAVSFVSPHKGFNRPKCLFYDDKIYVLCTKGSCSQLWRFVVQTGERAKENCRLSDVQTPCIVGHGRSIFFFSGNKLFRYDPISSKLDNWVLSDITPCRGQTASVYHGQLCIFGGKDAEHQYSNKLYLVDLTALTVQTIEPKGEIPPPRWHHEAVIHHGHLYICGGKGSDGLLGDLYRFHFEHNQWSRIDIPNIIPRKHHKCCIMGKYLVIIGGSSNTTQVVHMRTMEASNCVDYGNCPPVFKYGDISPTKHRQILVISEQNVYSLVPPAVVASEARSTSRCNVGDVSDAPYTRKHESRTKVRFQKGEQDALPTRTGRLERSSSSGRLSPGTMNGQPLELCESPERAAPAPDWSGSSSTELMLDLSPRESLEQDETINQPEIPEEEPEEPPAPEPEEAPVPEPEEAPVPEPEELPVPEQEEPPAPQPEEPKQEEEPEKKSTLSTPAKIAIATVAVAAIAGLGVFIFGRVRRR